MTPPRFRIYYGDGSTYSGDPYFAPPAGVQVVAQENRKYPMSGKHAYYWLPESGWHACDEAGMWDHWLMYRGPKAVIFGREMERDEEFWEIVTRARREGVG